MLSSLSKGYGSWTAGQVDPYYGEKYVSIKIFLIIILSKKFFNSFIFFFIYRICRSISCADTGIFARGVQARLPKNSSDVVVFFSVFLGLNLFYSGLSMVYFRENYNFPRFQRGPTFSRGGV